MEPDPDETVRLLEEVLILSIATSPTRRPAV
jgi:hypothetical protein